MSPSDLSADAVPVHRVPGEAGETADPRVDAAREAHRRAGEQLRAAQEAARGARLARQKADALDKRVTLLEAQFLARWERRGSPLTAAPTTSASCRGICVTSAAGSAGRDRPPACRGRLTVDEHAQQRERVAAEQVVGSE